MLGITKPERVMFFSAGGGGRVSDKQSSIDPSFFEKISMGDSILADRRFTFKEEFAAIGATLKIRHFPKGTNQLSGKEVQYTSTNSNTQETIFV